MAKQDFITEHTYAEFLEHVSGTDRSERSKRDGRTSSTESGASFSGTDTFDEAMQLAIHGWDAGIEQMKLEEGVLTGVGVEYNPNVRGQRVNVPAYLNGAPNCMYEMTEKREYNLEPLTIYVPLMYNAGTTVQTSMRFCVSIAKIVNQYQATHNVKLVGVFYCWQDDYDGNILNKIVIKDFDERFVLNNVAFSFHTSFFRRLWFKWLETTDYCSWGYGRSNCFEDTRRAIEKNELNDSNEKAMLLPTLGSLGVRGEFNDDKIKFYNF